MVTRHSELTSRLISSGSTMRRLGLRSLSRDLLDRLIVIDTNKDDVGLLRAIDAINSLSKSR